jgi:hypothetical protein
MDVSIPFCSGKSKSRRSRLLINLPKTWQYQGTGCIYMRPPLSTSLPFPLFSIVLLFFYCKDVVVVVGV